jgi:excinuclease UvrABC helicase subunit UvrB
LIIFIILFSGAFYGITEYVVPFALENLEKGTVTFVRTVTPQTFAAKETTLKEKIDELQNDLMERLAACESGDTLEPDAAIILDTNNKMSIGKYMWQVASVQHYVKLFYGREVSRKDATLIALNSHPEISVDELTKKVIFEDDKNLENWHNCSKAKGLYTELEFINRLAN